MIFLEVNVMQLISIGKFAKMVGVPTSILRRMHESRELIPAHITKGGTRYYSTEQLKIFTPKIEKEKIVVGYCRVSTPLQKDELKIQIDHVQSYMYAKGYQFEIIQDIGNGINYKKKGLQNLISKINNKEISKLVLLYQDILTEYGFELIEHLCSINNIGIEIIEKNTQSQEKDLINDLLQLTTIFANKLYGQRSNKTKKLIDKIKQNISSV